MIVEKLVRDGIVQKLRAEGRNPKSKILLSDSEFQKALKVKLREEMEELLSSRNYFGIVEEAADLLEVLSTYLASKNITRERVEEERVRKQQQNGGFDGRTFLCSYDPPTRK